MENWLFPQFLTKCFLDFCLFFESIYIWKITPAFYNNFSDFRGGGTPAFPGRYCWWLLLRAANVQGEIEQRDCLGVDHKTRISAKLSIRRKLYAGKVMGEKGWAKFMYTCWSCYEHYKRLSYYFLSELTWIIRVFLLQQLNNDDKIFAFIQSRQGEFHERKICRKQVPKKVKILKNR